MGHRKNEEKKLSPVLQRLLQTKTFELGEINS
jgi:hypothetical protein